MQPSVANSLKQKDGKEASCNISSPSAASSGYGSSAEDESSLSPSSYQKLSKYSSFELSHDFERIHKPSLTNVETLYYFSEPFLDDSDEGLLPEGLNNLDKSTYNNSLSGGEIHEVKPQYESGLLDPWHGKILCNSENSDESTSAYAEIKSIQSPPVSSSVDFFTEFFKECTNGRAENSPAAEETSQEQETTPCKNDNEIFKRSTEIEAKNHIQTDDRTRYKIESEQTQNISLLQDLNEIDEMLNFVFETDENPICTSENNVHSNLFIDSFDYTFDKCKTESPACLQNVVNSTSTTCLSSTVDFYETNAKHPGETKIKRKRHNSSNRDSPSKSQKQDSLCSYKNPSYLQPNSQLQLRFDGMPSDHDSEEFESFNFTHDNNITLDSQITKDTFLSNFSFQINESESDDVVPPPNETITDDVKYCFGAPLDVGEIFSNLQFNDLQNDCIEDVAALNDPTAVTLPQTTRPIQPIQQSNCNYFIIAVSTSLSSPSLASCIVIKPNSSDKTDAQQSTASVKTEPVVVQSSKINSHQKVSSSQALKKELKESNSSEDKAKVLQTILTCGSVRLNANQGSDAIYESILRGNLSHCSSDNSGSNFRFTSTLSGEKSNSPSSLTKSASSGQGSKSSSGNILHRLLKEQISEREIHRRPLPTSGASHLRQCLR